MLRKVAFAFLLASALVSPSFARAQEPVEGEGSAERQEPQPLTVVGGHTLEEGQRAVVAGYGWPGLSVAGIFAVGSSFDIGLMGRLLQGSPIMGLPLALGFDLSVPMRLHLFGRDGTDVSLSLRPYGLVGRASLVGLEGPGERDFGYAFGGQGGVRVGHRLNEKVLVGLGVHGSLDYTAVPDADSSDLVGTVTGSVGIESLFTRATAFFITAEAGYGFAPETAFDTHLVVRGMIGFAHQQYR